MDRAYVELSLRVGFFCGCADDYLGSNYFCDKVKLMCWCLTPALFETIKQEALAMGVPEAALIPPAEFEAMLPILIAKGIDMVKNEFSPTMH